MIGFVICLRHVSCVRLYVVFAHFIQLSLDGV